MNIVNSLQNQSVTFQNIQQKSMGKLTMGKLPIFDRFSIKE